MPDDQELSGGPQRGDGSGPRHGTSAEEGWIAAYRELSSAVGEGGASETCGGGHHLGLPGHDPLTGLPDRRLFQRRLSRAVERLRGRSDYSFAVCFIDLDGFKRINDRFGHLAGDRVLCEIARRLVGCVRRGDMAARFGGDEYTMLIDDLRGAVGAEPAARRMLEEIRRPIDIEGLAVRIEASIGVAIGRGGSPKTEDLLRQADVAMYRVKAGGGGGVDLYERPDPSI